MPDEPVVDKTYQRTPIGQEIKRWLEALQYEDSPATTRDSYETMGARLATDFAHLDGLHELTQRGGDGIGKLRWFLTRHWGDSAPATRRQRRSALSSLFEWAVVEELIEWNPVDRIKPPRGKAARRSAHPQKVLLQLLDRQDSLRDEVCLELMARLGLRKDAVRSLQARDIRRTTGEIGFRLKGGGYGVLPYDALETLAAKLELLLDVEAYKPRDYLLYPQGDRTRPMNQSTMHRWFKRCLDKADLPDMPMHELRHSAADFTRRATDYYVAKDLLCHTSVSTTETYLHSDIHELREKLRRVEQVWVEVVREETV